MSQTYCGRFAPSPTGPLHFGSLLAALGSYCQARHQQGRWLVRIDDLDRQRTLAGAGDTILRSLEKYGLTWDGGVLYQSRRDSAYQDALSRLQGQGIVYACSCSRREIAGVAQAGSAGPIYPGTCRSRQHHGEKPTALRVNTHNFGIEYEDALQGPQGCDLEREVGDFVLQRADGQFAYHLAVVVDDAEQQITEVVRGADLLSCTGPQIFLQQRLHYPTPGYLHLPVVLNRQRQKLSKQNLAPPIPLDNPVPALLAALSLLEQHHDPHLRYGSAEEICAWAASHWNPQAIPQRLELVYSGPY